MNNIRSTMLTLVRNYSKQGTGMMGIKSKVKLAEVSENELDLDEMEVEDMDEGASDFKDVGQSYNQYTRELKMQKLKLKQRIVARKVFKEEQPSFLTFIEKDRIKKLHENDPKEWTVEKLSECFPALPDTIRKILGSKWLPTSTDRVVEYDMRVVENWKKFKSDKLALSPELRDHLTKFKNRKISLTNRKELAEQLIPPKVELPKPKSKLFLSMLQGYVDNEESNKQRLISSVKDESVNKEVVERENESIAVLRAVPKESVETPIVWSRSHKQANINAQNIPTFNDFVKDKLEELYKGSPEKAVGLLQEYNKHVKSLKSKKSKTNVTNDSADAKKNAEKSNALEEQVDLPVTKTQNTREFDVLEKELISSESMGSTNLQSAQKLQASAKTLLAKTNEHAYNPQHHERQRFTFSEFVKAKLETIYKESPEEGTVLLHAYRQQVEQENSNNAGTDLSNDVTYTEDTNVAVAKATAMAPTTEDTLVAIKEEDNKSAALIDMETVARSLDTYIKDWKKTIETDFNYTKTLKIPKSLYKIGTTYRVKDCYYDYDGEFLYRIPGVRS